MRGAEVQSKPKVGIDNGPINWPRTVYLADLLMIKVIALSSAPVDRHDAIWF